MPSRRLMIAAILISPLLANAEKPAVYLSFQVPDSIATYPVAVNQENDVTGYYISPSGVTHGFVREACGKINKFDVPGSTFTQPVSINNSGEVTGSFENAGDFFPQGFVRDSHGTITVFPTNSGNFENGFYAQPVAINRTGEIVGNFPFPEAEPSVFVRSRTGAVSFFTLSFGADYPTVATGLNDSGAIIGYSTSEALEVAQGYLYSGKGPLPSPITGGVTGISVEGSLGTYPLHINEREDVVGCYSIGTDVWDPSPAFYDFLWQKDGTVTTFTVPGTVPSCIGDVVPFTVYSLPPQIMINDRGFIVGSFLNQQGIPTGFIRTDHGQLSTFSHPEADMTMPTAVNNDDVIIGYFSKGTQIKGFIRLPEE